MGESMNRMDAAVIAIVALAGVAGFAVIAYRREWRWTGLPADPGDGSPTNPARPAKTLWDWMQLLIVPLVLAIAAFALDAAQSDRDRRQVERRAAEDRRIEARRASRERSIAEDRAREDALRVYLQQMSDLITDHWMPMSRRPGSADTRTLARTLTLVALRRLDGTRKGLVVQFLHETEMITATSLWERTHRGLERSSSPEPQLSLVGADLREAVMPRVLLSFTDAAGPGGRVRTRAAVLDGADLRQADLRGRQLTGVSLENADLRGVDFRRADISGASLVNSCLSGANFRAAAAVSLPADFGYTAGAPVDFSHADLNDASFVGARLADVRLEGTSTEGVRWPPGWTPTGIRMHPAATLGDCGG